MSAREEQFEALADTLGDADFSYNELDSSDEAVTCIKRGTSVEVVAEHILVAGYRKPEIIGYVVVDREGKFIKDFGADSVAAQAFAVESTEDCKDTGIDWDYRVAAITEHAA